MISFCGPNCCLTAASLATAEPRSIRWLPIMRSLHHDMRAGVPICVQYVKIGVHEVKSANIVVIVNHVVLEPAMPFVGEVRSEVPVEQGRYLGRLVSEVITDNCAQHMVFND
jgi:hypothetical protein